MITRSDHVILLLGLEKSFAFCMDDAFLEDDNTFRKWWYFLDSVCVL